VTFVVDDDKDVDGDLDDKDDADEEDILSSVLIRRGVVAGLLVILSIKISCS
jgi:hypothetical protein